MKIVVSGQFSKIRSSINLPWGHVRSQIFLGYDRFSCFDVYWIKQTNTQLNTQTDKLNLYLIENLKNIVETTFSTDFLFR